MHLISVKIVHVACTCKMDVKMLLIISTYIILLGIHNALCYSYLERQSTCP